MPSTAGALVDPNVFEVIRAEPQAPLTYAAAQSNHGRLSGVGMWAVRADIPKRVTPERAANAAFTTAPKSRRNAAEARHSSTFGRQAAYLLKSGGRHFTRSSNSAACGRRSRRP
jgi:hypothetical protein